MIQIRKPQTQDAHAIRMLFEAYPYKAYQQKRQGIDPQRLAAMFLEGTLRAVDAEDTDLFLAVEEIAGSETVHGLAGLAPNAWHSEAFGLKTGRVQPFTVPGAQGPVAQALIEAVDRAARHRGYDHLTARVDHSDWPGIHALEAIGFYLVDASQKLARPLGIQPFTDGAAEADLSFPGQVVNGPDGLVMDQLDPEDIDALCDIASSSHHTNHFYNDPALSVSDSRALFERWVRRCCDGLARHVFVARHGLRPVGFVTYLGAETLKKKLGLSLIILDFVVIQSDRQGRGIGEWLVKQSLNRIATCYDWVELRTSANNYPALALYHKLGFRNLSTDMILHKVYRNQ